MFEKSQNFKKIFPFNFKYFTKNKGVLVSDRIQSDANFRTIFLANILNEKYKYNPYLISDLNDKKNIPVYKNFNFKKFSINLKIKNLNYLFIFVNSFFDFLLFYIKIIFSNDKMNWLINNFKCKEVKIGDLIYDYYIRYDHKFLNPSIYEIKFYKILFDGILKTHFINYVIKKKKSKY